MKMASEHSRDDLSYRERDVHDTLSDHEQRISRLEKAALVGFGYGLASGAQIVQQFAPFL